MSAKNFDYLNEPLRSYLNSLSAETPCPGGGSAAACVAALSCALIGMVIRYTCGREKYQLYEEQLTRIKIENDEILQKLSEYIEQDSSLYEHIRKYTKENLSLAEKYLKKSVQMHLDICRITLRLTGFAEFLFCNGNKNLLSDTAISAEFAFSACKAAKINILINLMSIMDKEFCQDILSEIESMEKDIENKSQRVYIESVKRLRTKSK